MEIEIVPVVEVPEPKKTQQRPVWIDEPANNAFPSFLHMTGAVDQEGRLIVVVLGSRLPKCETFSISTLAKYIEENMEIIGRRDFVLLYCHSDKVEKRGYPELEWCRALYDSLDYQLKKSLKRVILLHSAANLENAMKVLFKSFISPKVFRKVSYLYFVDQLGECGIDVKALELPISVYDNDVRMMIRRRRVSTDIPSMTIHKLPGEEALAKGLKRLGKLTKRSTHGNNFGRRFSLDGGI
eukprot:Plantae.Rhodophyta-Purpureofilum_apyrenoidigerum.ctg15186.p1 GENE.Plantae.Rhodophyta-Purpureofilum_apyrenoidigerum.ctg15186~~Plantae.Rhodophyta-Purpureofilum_apyrenoidigerum.ctg15186.p1  ORF type:complete len:277 (-),score=50.77 Plantae.Rhodophyta-Purpureofilum_apyrenoidigerum.ctg15186:880-1599(-)